MVQSEIKSELSWEIEFPNLNLVEVEEHLVVKDFEKQRAKQMEYLIRGAAIGIVWLMNVNKIVLVNRTGPHSGWALPGGRVGMNETFLDAFKREILEELGIETLRDIKPFILEKKVHISPSGEKLPPLLLATYTAETCSLPKSTTDARIEGITWGVFSVDALPSPMVEQDRIKVERWIKNQAQLFGI